MVTKKYTLNDKKEPTLKGTGVHGVAEFEGNIDIKKTLKSKSIPRIISGIILILIGVAGYFFSDSLHLPDTLQFGGFHLVWMILPIIGLVLMLVKAKTALIIEIELKGESYQYKGNKQVESTEEKQRLDVISDIRISIIGFIEDKSQYREEFAAQLKQDVQFIKEKLDGIVPEYRMAE